MGNKERITIEKDVFIAIMNILAMSAFATNHELNKIGREIDVANCQKKQDGSLSYDVFGQIEKCLTRLGAVNHLLFKAIPADAVSITDCVKEVMGDEDFKKFLDYYGADLSDNGNYDMI